MHVVPNLKVCSTWFSLIGSFSERGHRAVSRVATYSPGTVPCVTYSPPLLLFLRSRLFPSCPRLHFVPRRLLNSRLRGSALRHFQHSLTPLSRLRVGSRRRLL